MTVTPELHPPKLRSSERWIAVTEVLREVQSVKRRRRLAKLHLFTYAIGNAIFWALLGAISIGADTWYWWPVLPLVGWAIVLGVHLAYAFRDPSW
ncbi:MAG TPA: 2TM domain-containing protein [Gaiellaceae bacterium]